MAYPSPRRLQLRRGNASAISSYLGYAGELVVDTTNWTLYVHDGVTVGGYAATVNTASISGNINSILNGTAVFGNIIPSANTVYSLGNITHQWKSLFVSNNTIYVGGVPLGIDATGNLTVNGNIIPTIGYVNAQVANVTVDLSAYALNANVTAANVGLKGYVDLANTIQSAQLTAANTAWAANASAQQSLIGNLQASAYSNVQVATYLPTYDGNIAANISKAGYTWTFGSTGTLTVPANGIITAPINQEFQLQAKAADSVLRNEINLDPNNGTYMSVWSDELNTSFSTGAGSWVTASWNNEDGFGAARFTGAEDLQNFWTTGPGSFVDSVEVSINGGARGRAGYEGNNGGGYGVYLSVDQVPPGGQGTTVPITSLVFYFRTKNRIDIDYLNGQLLLNTQSMNINLETNSYINLKSTRANPVRIITNNNTHMWEFDSTGSLTLPREGKIYGIGQGAASDRYGYISWAGNSSGDGSGFNTMRLVPDLTGLEAADQYIIIDPTGGVPGHIHIRAGGTQDNSLAHLFLGGENSHVKISAGLNPPVTVLANNNAWTFGTDGDLTLPGATAGETIATSGGYITVGNLLIGQGGSLFNSNNDSWALYGNISDPGATIFIPSNADADNGLALYIESQQSNVEIRSGSGTWNFDTDGNLTLPNVASVSINYANGVSILSGLGGGGGSYSNVNVAAYLATATINTTGNITAGNLFTSGALYVANITTTGASGNISGANYITANYFVGNGALLTGLSSSYSNVQVATYLPTYDGVVTAGNVAVNGNVTAQYFLGNGAFLTGIVGGAGNYGNIDVKAFLETDAGFADGFQRVIEGYYSNIILGDSTKLFSFGNSSKSYFGHDGFLGNASINYIRADNGDVRIATNNAAYTWIFDRDGNLTLSGNTFSVNYANGTPVTFSSSSYSNVQVATYLPTYSGNVSALNFVGAIQAQVGSSFAYATDAYGSLFVSGGVALPADTNSNAIVAGYTIVGNSGAVTLTVTSATFIPGTPNIVQVATTPTASSLAFPVTVYTANYSPAKSSTITVGNATVSGNVSATYFLGNGALLTGIVAGGGNYSNVQVATYLPTYSGNIAANISKAGYTWTFGSDGSLTIPGDIRSEIGANLVLETFQATTTTFTDPYPFNNPIWFNWYGGEDPELPYYLNIRDDNVPELLPAFQNLQIGDQVVVVKFYGPPTPYTLTLLSTIQTDTDAGGTYHRFEVDSYPAEYSVNLASVAIPSETNPIWTFGTNGNLTFPDNTVQTTAFNNNAIATYLQSGNIANISVAGNVTAAYFLGNGALLTGIVAGGSSYSNVEVAAYLNTQGYNLYSNVNVAAYLSTATITTTGNITAQNLIGNISITGNVTGTSANVTLQAGAYTSVFDNQGNVRLPTAYVTGNVTANYFVGNGALLTGIAASSNYSNVNVATYLPTYSGVVGASNVFVSGNVTAQYFLGNGALLTGIASSYSNVQVATYLPTYTGNIANVRLSSSGALTFPDGTQQTTAAFGGGGNYGNANVAAFLPTYTGTTGITAVGTLATLSVTGNTTVGNLVGTEANTRIIANVYTTTFDIYGNVSFPGNITTSSSGYFMGNALGTTAAYTGNVTVGGNLTIIGTKNNVPVKTGGFVAQNTAVSIDSITAQWLNTGAASANQLSLAALNGNVSILYTYTFQDGTGGSTTGGSSSTTLANLSFGWTSIGNPSGVAGDMYNVLVTLPGTNAYRITAMTGSGYSDNVLTVERLI